MLAVLPTPVHGHVDVQDDVHRFFGDLPAFHCADGLVVLGDIPLLSDDRGVDVELLLTVHAEVQVAVRPSFPFEAVDVLAVECLLRQRIDRRHGIRLHAGVALLEGEVVAPEVHVWRGVVGRPVRRGRALLELLVPLPLPVGQAHIPRPLVHVLGDARCCLQSRRHHRQGHPQLVDLAGRDWAVVELRVGLLQPVRAARHGLDDVDLGGPAALVGVQPILRGEVRAKACIDLLLLMRE
mmetsp:Transcript_47938/g.128273  ORF Transcript_47938/g.128273 Transcript_47938/m.128273 type:complete len:238 (-) Transcript_47938:689-1402(-)